MKTTARIVMWLVTGLCVGVVGAATLPNLLGYKSTTVLTGSMRPYMQPGDMVVSKMISPAEAKVGDIVTYREPGSTRLITHRLRGVERKGTKFEFVTKGDANDAAERWQSPANGQISTVAYRIPKLGFAAQFVSHPNAKLMLVVIPALLLAMFELVRIWRPERSTPDQEENFGGTTV